MRESSWQGKGLQLADPMLFFFFLHEMSARRGRKEYIAIPCACKSKPGACPYTLDAQFYPPSALRSELLLSLMISFAKIQWAASAASHMDRRGLGRGGILRHKDNNIIPVTCGDLLLCLVASITLVSLHSICSGRLSFTLFQAAAASRTFWDYRRSPEGSYVWGLFPSLKCPSYLLPMQHPPAAVGVLCPGERCLCRFYL